MLKENLIRNWTPLKLNIKLIKTIMFSVIQLFSLAKKFKIVTWNT